MRDLDISGGSEVVIDYISKLIDSTSLGANVRKPAQLFPFTPSPP
jgi:hypothetical protein